jgi:hypothetical protein
MKERKTKRERDETKKLEKWRKKGKKRLLKIIDID